MTQFGRSLHALNIDILCANTPQAKGRVERANKTLQDRLVKELRLQGISTIAAGNQLLPDEIAGLAAAGEIGSKFAELALDLQLLRLPPRLRGADLCRRFALLDLMQAPLQRNAQTDLRQITVRAVAGAVDRPGFQHDVRIPALVGELFAGRGRSDLRVAAGKGRIAGRCEPSLVNPENTRSRLRLPEDCDMIAAAPKTPPSSQAGPPPM
jgi:hypothetical protein